MTFIQEIHQNDKFLIKEKLFKRSVHIETNLLILKPLISIRSEGWRAIILPCRKIVMNVVPKEQ